METNIKQPEELISWSEMVEQFGDFIPKKYESIFKHRKAYRI